jgi:hypothetical protein
VSAVRWELGFYILEDGILHSHRRENLKSYVTEIIEDRARLEPVLDPHPPSPITALILWACLPLSTFLPEPVISGTKEG